jgi:hypothetical protein
MSASTILNPHDPAFDSFLYASVGEDHAGSPVSMLSALARLKLDPWEEAADLAALSREAAELRLGQLLALCRDVPTLGQDHHAIATTLISLLPGRRTRHEPAAARTRRIPAISWVALLTIAGLVFVLIQLFSLFGSGPGA